MESLSDADSYWSLDQELAPTSTAYTIPRFRAKTSDYDTGFSTAEFDKEKKHSKKSGKVRKVRLRIYVAAPHSVKLLSTVLHDVN